MKSKYSGLYALILLVAFSTFASAQNTIVKTKDTIANRTTTFDVKGITCQSDLSLITDKVKTLDGIVTVETFGKVGPTSSFKIVYDPSVVSREELVKTIEDSPSCDFPDQKPYKVKKKN